MPRLARALVGCTLVAGGCRFGFTSSDDGGTTTQPAPRLASHGTSSCIRSIDGIVQCWGRGEVGQLGNGVVYSAGSEPVTHATRARAIGVGERSNCALDADGVLACWGDDATYQLGDGITRSPPYSASPVLAATDRRYVEVALGEQHGCAVTTTGTVDCWGMGACGRLGTGTVDDQMAPTPVALDRVVHIGVQDNGGCAIRDDGTLWCWGSLLGDAVCHTDLSSPQLVPFPGRRVLQVNGGCHQTMCVLLDDGDIACWGVNFGGSLGNGTMASSPTPSKVINLPPALEVAVGATNGCARTTDGVYCWGDNNRGQLGIDDLAVTRTLSPVRVPFFDSLLPDELDVACGHACALAGDALYCWGTNDNHELADGTTTMRASPTRATSVTPRRGVPRRTTRRPCAVPSGCARGANAFWTRATDTP